MAELQHRFEKGIGTVNGVGEFFVSEQCIDCDLCRQMAPEIFKRKWTGTGGYSFVERQPVNPTEHKQAAEALDACPVGAIQKGRFASTTAKAA